MSKKDWFLILMTVPGLILLDQLIKIWALSTITTTQVYGPIGLSIFHNPGVFLGAFSKLPPILRVVSLSTGGGFLLFLYAMLQYLIRKRSFLLRLGMSFFIGGVLGNIVDRVFRGAIVDYIFFLFPGEKTSPIFNLADAVQWVGYLMIVVFILMHATNIWPEKEERKKIWINPSFQMKYILVFLTVGSMFSVITGIYSYTYLKITIQELVGKSSVGFSNEFLFSFLVVFLVMCSVFLLMLSLIARVLSHRLAGPLYAFESFLKDILSGKDRSLRLRAGDELNHLVDLSEKVREKIKNLKVETESQKNKKEEPLK